MALTDTKKSEILHLKSLPESHSTTTTCLTASGDPAHGGALFILPREIRDEIYRLMT